MPAMAKFDSLLLITLPPKLGWLLDYRLFVYCILYGTGVKRRAAATRCVLPAFVF